LFSLERFMFLHCCLSDGHALVHMQGPPVTAPELSRVQRRKVLGRDSSTTAYKTVAVSYKDVAVGISRNPGAFSIGSRFGKLDRLRLYAGIEFDLRVE